MAYAELHEVESLMAKFSIDASGKPDGLRVEEIIEAISNEVDVALAAGGYTVPVTTPAYFLAWLGTLNAYGATAAVLKSMFPDAAGATDGSIAIYTFWEKRYQDGLTGLMSGSMVPPDVPGNEATVQPSTYLTRNPETEETLGTIAEPVFTMGKVF